MQKVTIARILLSLSSTLVLACSSVDHVTQAQIAYEREEFDVTVEQAQLALEVTEGHREARVLLAQAHRKLAEESVGDLERTLHHLVEAAIAEPSRRKRGQDALVASREAKDVGRADLSLEMAALAVEADPASMEIRRHVAVLLDEASEPSRAVTHYLWIWEADRSLVPIGLRLGLLYAQLEQFANAEAVYARVLEREPENVQASLGRAEALEKSGYPNRSEEIYHELARKFPDNASLIFRYADFVARQGDEARAERLRRQARGELPTTEKRRLRKLPPSRR